MPAGSRRLRVRLPSHPTAEEMAKRMLANHQLDGRLKQNGGLLTLEIANLPASWAGGLEQSLLGRIRRTLLHRSEVQRIAGLGDNIHFDLRNGLAAWAAGRDFDQGVIRSTVGHHNVSGGVRASDLQEALRDSSEWFALHSTGGLQLLGTCRHDIPVWSCGWQSEQLSSREVDGAALHRALRLGIAVACHDGNWFRRPYNQHCLIISRSSVACVTDENVVNTSIELPDGKCRLISATAARQAVGILRPGPVMVAREADALVLHPVADVCVPAIRIYFEDLRQPNFWPQQGHPDQRELDPRPLSDYVRRHWRIGKVDAMVGTHLKLKSPQGEAEVELGLPSTAEIALSTPAADILFDRPGVCRLRQDSVQLSFGPESIIARRNK